MSPSNNNYPGTIQNLQTTTSNPGNSQIVSKVLPLKQLKDIINDIYQ